MNRWLAPGTISIFTSQRILAMALRFMPMTGTSWPPTISSVGTFTRSSASPVRSGRPPRETIVRTTFGRCAAAMRAAPAPVLAPK
jgi:hypothetical protein